MKKAFTMIELIFVIVIIGILAAVAIPKLAASRDDAEATVCTKEVGQLIQEISKEYIKVGYNEFSTTLISDISNINILSAGLTNGITLDSVVHNSDIIYVCNDEEIVTIVGNNANHDYNLTVTVNSTATTPAAINASEDILKNILGGVSPKIFKL